MREEEWVTVSLGSTSFQDKSIQLETLLAGGGGLLGWTM